MTHQYTVGLKFGKRNDALVVEAEDALVAALRAKSVNPEAAITYVRKSNRRGDCRHPHHSISEISSGKQASPAKPG